MKIYLVLEDLYWSTELDYAPMHGDKLQGIFKTKERAEDLLEQLGGPHFNEDGEMPRFFIREFNTDKPELSVVEYQEEQARNDAEFELLLDSFKETLNVAN